MDLSPQIINSNWRFEYKHRLTHQQYQHVRSAILPYMKKDRYTLASPSQRYRPGLIDFEIKCFKMRLPWLRELVQQHGLRVNTNNKYIQGIEIARSDLVRASWSH